MTLFVILYMYIHLSYTDRWMDGWMDGWIDIHIDTWRVCVHNWSTLFLDAYHLTRAHKYTDVS